MADKNPYSPIGVPEGWQGKMRVYGVKLANALTDLYRRLMKQERLNSRVDRATNSSHIAIFGVPSGSSHFVAVVSNTTGSRFVGFVYANSSGTVTVQSLHATSNVSTGTATNQFKVTFNSDTTAHLADTILYGNPIT